MEGAGEDPYLGSILAAAYVRGFQGTDMSRPDKVMAWQSILPPTEPPRADAITTRST